MVLVLALLLSGCSWRLHRDVALSTESAGVRHNLVISKPNSRALTALVAAKGLPWVTRMTAKQVSKIWQADKYVCPSANTCVTTSEYIRGSASDLGGAVEASERARDCVALTLTPSYNWTHKGRSTGCFG